MAAAWPSISTTQYLELTIQPLDQRSTFQTDAGGPKLASLSTDQLYAVTFDMQLSTADLGTFWTWWEGTAARGAERVTGLQEVTGSGSATYVFAPGQVPRFVKVRDASGDLWRATFNMIQIA